MSAHANTTVIVTGATSGLGREAATQFAAAGYGRVIVTGRTDRKAQTAQDQLHAGSALGVFEALALDLDDLGSAGRAADELARRGGKIDVVLLNAGIAPPGQPRWTGDGIEATAAATLTGHHAFVMRLLTEDLLADDARIIIAGSEAARGDFPGFTPLDLNELASRAFDGDLEAAARAVLRLDAAVEYRPNAQYATIKLFAAWWAAELAPKLPRGMTVNAVSPGSTPGTDGARDAPFLMRRVMIPIVKLVPGLSHSVQDGAARYLEAATFPPDRTGHFYASRPRRGTGPLQRVQMEHIDDPSAQAALWRATVAVTGAATPSRPGADGATRQAPGGTS